MTSIIDLTKDGDVRELAQGSDILAGHEIVKDGSVVFGVFNPDEKIEATVMSLSTSKRTTVFELRDGNLSWRCTCTSTDKFCKHLVATALAAQARDNGDIYKAAGLIIKDRGVLAERSAGKPVFVQPGGRIGPGETPKQALVRELKEEFSMDVDEADLEPFGTFSAAAANHPTQQVHMEVFTVKKWRGEIKPDSEVEEILWLTSDLPKDKEIGSIFVHDIIPRLKERDLID